MSRSDRVVAFNHMASKDGTNTTEDPDDFGTTGDASYYAIGAGAGAAPAMAESFQGALSSCEDHSTESRMCTEESVERMTSSTEGMVSLSEDSSGRDTYAQAHVVRQWSGSPSNAGTPAGASGGCGGGRAAEGGAVGGYLQHSDTVEQDESDEQMNPELLGSYHEISFEEADNEARTRDRSALLGDDTEEEVSNLSPDSGPLSPLDDGRDANYDYSEDYSEADHFQNGSDGKWEGGSSSRRPNSLHLIPSPGSSTSVRPSSSASKSHHHQQQQQQQHPRGAHGLAANLVASAAASAPQPSTSTASSEMDVGGSSNFALDGLHGLVQRDGEMVSFVAEDLQEQIRRASPVVWLGDTPSFPGSRSSTPSLYRQALTPQIAPIDPSVLNDLEVKARSIAASVDNILENLTGTLHSMSSLTVDCMESYHDAVCKTCDCIDGNIKSMYQLMAKFEEIGNLMRPVYRLSNQVKEIKRLLELLEQVSSSGGS